MLLSIYSEKERKLVANLKQFYSSSFHSQISGHNPLHTPLKKHKNITCNSSIVSPVKQNVSKWKFQQKLF